MSIICPGVSYHEALVIMNFKELATHHDEICESLFHTIANDNNHRLYRLLPAPQESTYSLRYARPFHMPRFKTDRFKNSFIRELKNHDDDFVDDDRKWDTVHCASAVNKFRRRRSVVDDAKHSRVTSSCSPQAWAGITPCF